MSLHGRVDFRHVGLEKLEEIGFDEILRKDKFENNFKNSLTSSLFTHLVDIRLHSH